MRKPPAAALSWLRLSGFFWVGTGGCIAHEVGLTTLTKQQPEAGFAGVGECVILMDKRIAHWR